MEWLILLLLIPVILVPIVLLCGFAGCGLDVEGTLEVPEDPSNLHATLLASRKGIHLRWLHTGPQANFFDIERTTVPGEPIVKFSSPLSTYDDISPTLKPGVTFHYQVRAHTTAGPSLWSNEAFATMPPAAPVLSVVATDLDKFEFSWPLSANATKYRLQHLPDLRMVYYGGPPTADIFDTVAPESQHQYQIIAIIELGFDDSVLKVVESDLYDSGPVATLQWNTIFATTNIPPNPQNGVNATNDCIVQRINGVMGGGSFVRLTLRGIANQTTALSAVSISKAVAATALQPWNFADQPVAVTFGGAAGVPLQNGEAKVSDKIKYKIDFFLGGQDLLIALDVGNGSGRILRRDVPTALAFVGNNRAEALPPPGVNRSAGYNTNNNRVYCIEKIELA